jgi:hypothetical protein
MSTQEPNDTKSFSPPYISFRTLMNAIQRMEAEGMPSRLDRSYLSNLPWSSQNHFLAACRSLELIDEAGRPTPALILMVEDPAKRSTTIAKLLHEFYPGPTGLSQNATQAELEEAFKAYGLSGSTARKAVAFFLHAAAYAEVLLSPHFRSPRTTDRAPSKRKAKAKNPSARPGPTDGALAPPEAPTNTLQLHPFIEGLLRELPGEDATWDKAKRERWLKMAELTVDMLYPVEDQE